MRAVPWERHRAESTGDLGQARIRGGTRGGTLGTLSGMPVRNPRLLVTVSSYQKAVRVPRREIERLVAFVARLEGVRFAEADIAVVGAREIAALNRRYLDRAGPTDVLSFDLSESPAPSRSRGGRRNRGGVPIVAQIVVCADVAVREARLRQTPPQREMMLYVVHGLLHLTGYEDATVRGAARMHAREEEMLREFLEGRRRRRE